MISFEPNIAVIDDERLEIQGILDYYQNEGIGCKFFNASLFDGDEYPENTYSDINLIFLDLYYSDQTFDPELCSAWIRKILPEKTFYILIIWSKDKSKATDVLTELKKFKRNPYVHLVKSKTEYPMVDSSKYDFSKLFEDINAELEKIPALSEIGIWKKGLKRTANEIIGGLTKESDYTSLVKKIKKIIVSHGGTFIKSSKDDKRKRTILFDALDNVLVSNSKKSIHSEEISKVNKDSIYKLDTVDDYIIDKELNSWFHFKLDSELDKNLVVPGLISQNDHRFFRKHYSIQDDIKLSPRLETQISRNAKIVDVVLVITRPCDIAQSKFGKNIKLISGVLIQNPVRDKTGKVDFAGKLPDSTKLFDHLYFDDNVNDVTLLFDFRYVFSVPEQVFVDKFRNLKVFNKELISEIQVEYSSYSSRLGITQVI